MTHAEAAQLANGIKWFHANCAEFIPAKDYVSKPGLKWLRNNAASDDVNDEQFKVFLDKLCERSM